MRQYKYHIAVSDQNEKIWRDSKSHVRKQEQLIQELGSVEGAIQETLQPTNVSFRKELKSRPLDRKILEEIYKDLHGKRSERALKKNIHWEHWKAKCEENMPLILSSSQRAKETFGFGGKIVKVRSAKSLDQFPVSPLPEVGFFGRTNSGRSSLINAIVNTFICPYGHLKGTTTTANFYNIADKLMIVDLPGYGYYHPMQTNPLQSDNGYKLSRLYLKECGGTFNNARDDKTNESNSGRISTSTRNIKRLFICVPANTGLHDSDLHFCKSCNEMRIPFSIILTKTDTVTITMLARIADHTRSKMLPFSECKELFMANSLRLAGIGKLQTALGNIARREGLGSDSHIDELAFESIV